jgi:hypothetical protein
MTKKEFDSLGMGDVIRLTETKEHYKITGYQFGPVEASNHREWALVSRANPEPATEKPEGEQSVTFTFRLPKPGDELPFTVMKFRGIDIFYGLDGDIQGDYSLWLADILGFPAHIPTRSVVGVSEVGE